MVKWDVQKTLFCRLLKVLPVGIIEQEHRRNRSQEGLKSEIVMENSSTFLSHSTQRRRRVQLEKAMSEFVLLLEEEGYLFAEVLQVVHDYALQEKNKISSEKHSWEIVASVLELTSFEVMILSRHPAVRHKCVFLQQTTKKFIGELQSDEYRFTEILQALSQYASQASKSCNDYEQTAWREVARLLNLGAQQAQSEDRELP